MIDSKPITHYVYAHQRTDGRWIVHDHYTNMQSTTTYPTYQEATRRYRDGEVPMIHAD